MKIDIHHESKDSILITINGYVGKLTFKSDVNNYEVESILVRLKMIKGDTLHLAHTDPLPSFNPLICKVKNGKDYVGDIQIWDGNDPNDAEISSKPNGSFVYRRYIGTIRFRDEQAKEDSKILFKKMKEIFKESEHHRNLTIISK